MANLPEEKKWTGVYQWETSDRALAGPDTAFTRPIRNLTDRTAYLREQLATAQQSLSQHENSTNHPDASLSQKGFVQLSSALDSDSESYAATVKAVKAAYQLAQSKADSEHTHPFIVSRVNGQSGEVVLAAEDIGALRQGDFGLGSATPPLITDFTDDIKAGFYHAFGYGTDQPTLNGPPGTGNSVLYVIAQQFRGNNPFFIVYHHAADASALRSWEGILYQGKISWRKMPTVYDMPVGIPQPWPSATPPSGWLKCNGATFDKTHYPQLALAYPTGQLPDLRKDFIRGWNDDEAILSRQGATRIRAAVADYFGADTNTTGNSIAMGIWFGNADDRHLPPTATDLVSSGTRTVLPAAPYIADNLGLGGQNNHKSPTINSWFTVRPRNISFLYIVRAE